MTKARVLLADLVPANAWGSTLRTMLQDSTQRQVLLRYEAIVGSDLENRWNEIAKNFQPELIFLLVPDHELAKKLLRAAKGIGSEAQTLVILEPAAPDDLFRLLEMGAADFIVPPLKEIDVLPRVWRLLDRSQASPTFASTLKEKLGLKQLIGESPAFLRETKKIPLVARSDSCVLISGETGTGKELLARAIHYLSARSGQSFIPVNCGAIPLDLVENELFGHEPGAFTGAADAHAGLIQAADGGTLFLDEIDCLPPQAQVKLLRFLQEKEYRRLGSTKTGKADVRMIAAANIEFEPAVKAGKLRPDLYYRLNVIPIQLPPLRERREDIPLLARHFLAKYAARFSRPGLHFTGYAIEKLALHSWPGNVRELDHVVERAVVLSQQDAIGGDAIDLPGLECREREQSFQQAKSRVVAEFERDYLKGLLAAYHGNITHAAAAAQKNRRAFWQLVRKHQLDAKSFKPLSS
jgi:two-component system, NtrC family, response regulator GlrR